MNDVRPVQAFFAYPSRPTSIPETIQEAVTEINKSRVCRIETWQEISPSGKILIDVICRAIDAADVFIADLTGVNPNVLFELGYAIGRQKRVWLILDTTMQQSQQFFEQMKLLTTIGYAPYSNAPHIVSSFYRDQPWLNLAETIYKMSIEPALSNREEYRLLYLKNQHDTQASIRLSSIIDLFHLPVTINDPKESAVQSLVWYATKIWNSPGVIAHLSGPDRFGADLHNARYAFVSGLAHGFQKPLLMMAEMEYITPLDYRDLLRQYRTASECEQIANDWLEQLSIQFDTEERTRQEYRKSVSFALEMKNLILGEFIAENEENSLDEYFIETEPYRQIIEGRHTVIVGRRGSGKTASLYMAARHFRQDKRNLVCVIKPVSYDVQGIVRLGNNIKERDKKGYLAEALWKFLIFSELARSTYEDVVQLPYVDPTSPEAELMKMMDAAGSTLTSSFALRLEQCLEMLSKQSFGESLKDFHNAVSELLHKGILRDLRLLLGKILNKRERVIILIDNLDKAWDRRDDLEQLSDFLFGLLRVTNDIIREFSHKDHWRESVNISITVFLRSDIFSRVMKTAREPDKIQYYKLNWDDPEILLRVIDERLNVNRREENASAVWDKYLCRSIRGIPSRDYVVGTSLPRPRDIVFLVKAALSTAINRRHACVEESDFLEAEKEYSQFAFEGIQVENGISLPELGKIMYEFVGVGAILSESSILSIISKAGIEEPRQKYALRHLMNISFLGIQISDGEYRYCSSDEEIEKLDRLGKRFAEERNIEPQYVIHKAFHAYLETQ